VKVKGLRLDLLKQQEVSATDYATLKQRWSSEVEGLCGGEPVEAVGMFRQGGATASVAAGRAALGFGGVGGQLLTRSATSLARKKRAGGLPQRVLLAVTPTKLYAFDYSFEISRKRSEREARSPVEAAVWDRTEIRCATGKSGTMTTLTITSPAEGENATLVGGTSADDAWSQDVMKALGALPA
jgi:hypothetical protein